MSRPLGTLSAASLVVASMVGTGVFTTSGLLMDRLHSPVAVLLVWALGGVSAICGAVVYGELGTMMPRVGGEYVYLSRAFHPVAGFVSGWIALLAGFAAPIAAGSEAFGRYLAAAGAPISGRAAAVALIVVATGLHAWEVAWASRLQVALTAANLSAILVLTLAGGWTLLVAGPVVVEPVVMASSALAAPSSSSVGALAVGLVIVSYSYFGWGAAAYVAGELRQPQRALPRALVGGTACVTALYLALNAVFVFALPGASSPGEIAVAERAARALWGEGAARVLSLLIAGILAASVSALVMTGPRVYLAMAEDGLFLRAFSRRNARGAPSAGVLLQGVLALFFALSATFEALMIYIGFTLTLSAAATVAAAVWLRRGASWGASAERPYRTPLWPWPPVLFLATAAWMTLYAAWDRPRETAAGAATVITGALVYWLWDRRRRRPEPSPTPSGIVT